MDLPPTVDAFQQPTDNFSSGDGFHARPEGFSEKPGYHVASNSQAGTNMFVSPSSKEQHSSTVVGSERQQQSPRAVSVSFLVICDSCLTI